MPRRARQSTVHPIAVRELTVLRVTEVTPGMRRVTLTGEQLGAFTTPEGLAQREFASTGFDDDIRLIFPYPGETEPVLPIQKDGRVVSPKGRRPLAKIYTVRRHDPVARELDVDFVRHGVGVATTWAYRTRPGERIHIAGPSRSRELPAGADWLLVAGDDTAVPAIARLLEELPEDARAQVFIEVAEDDHRQALRTLPGVSVTWLSRGGAAAGTTTLLLDAVRGADWWDGAAFGWVAGEQAAVRDLRRHLIEDRGLDPDSVDFTGYWKRTEVVAMADDPAVPDPEFNQEAFERFHEQAELLPPLAIRLAASLGIGELVARGVTDVAALARRTGTDEQALGKFLRYLTAIELLEQTGPGRYRLSATGDFLTNELVLDVLHPDGVIARKELAFHGLAESLRTGRAAYATVTGRDYATTAGEPGFARTLLEQSAYYAEFVAEPLAKSPSLTGLGHVVVHSNGAAAIARAIVTAHPGTGVTIPATPSRAAWLREDLPRSVPDAAQRARIAVVEPEVTSRADAVLLVKVLAEHPDADAAQVLRGAAQSLTPDGRVLLVEDTLDPEDLDEHAAEADLLNLALYGSGNRTEAELVALVTRAGLRVHDTESIGWGNTLRVLALA